MCVCCEEGKKRERERERERKRKREKEREKKGTEMVSQGEKGENIAPMLKCFFQFNHHSIPTPRLHPNSLSLYSE